jgi:hypothetical protein
MLQHLRSDGHGTFFALGCLAADESGAPLRRVVGFGFRGRNHLLTLRCQTIGDAEIHDEPSEQPP